MLKKSHGSQREIRDKPKRSPLLATTNHLRQCGCGSKKSIRTPETSLQVVLTRSGYGRAFREIHEVVEINNHWQHMIWIMSPSLTLHSILELVLSICSSRRNGTKNEGVKWFHPSEIHSISEWNRDTGFTPIVPIVEPVPWWSWIFPSDILETLKDWMRLVGPEKKKEELILELAHIIVGIFPSNPLGKVKFESANGSMARGSWSAI